MKKFSTIIFFSIACWLLAQPAAGGISTISSLHYIGDDSLKLSPKEVLELYHSKKLREESSSLNLGYKHSTVWIVLKPGFCDEQQVLTIQNAHLDLIDIYHYSGNEQIDIQKSGDHLYFNSRDLNNHFFNFIVPTESEYIVARVSNEGPIFVPITIVSIRNVYSLLNNYSILHWMYFGFVFLILLSNILMFVWLRESIHLYFILFLISMAMVTAVDYGYTFQYLWPNNPEINKYNTLFYLGSISIIIFTSKLFKAKTNFPRIHLLFKACYVVFGIIAALNIFISYRTSIQIFTYTALFFNLLSLFVSIYFYKKIRNIVSTLYLIGWTVFILGTTAYIFSILVSVEFNFFLNNITQIASAIQIIFLNLAILSSISLLKKQKEQILTENNEMLEKHIETQDELIKTILNREKLLAHERTLNSTILDTTGGLIIMLDASGKIVAFNNACEKCSGYSFEELKGKFFWDYLIPKEEVEGIKKAFHLLPVNGLAARQYENNWIAKSGERRYIIWDNKTIKNEAGHIEYILGTGIDFTEKTLLERTVKKREITFNSIVNSMKDPFYALDKNLNIIQFNGAFKSLANDIFELDVKVGKYIAEGLKEKYNDYFPFYMEKYRQVLSGESISFTIHFKERDRYADVSMYPLWEEGEITGLFVLTKEITERVKQQEELKMSEEKYRTLTEHSPAAIMVYDFTDNKITEANAQACVFYSRSREEILQMHPFDLLPKYQENGNNSEEEVRKYLSRTSQGENVSYEIEMIDKHGKLIPSQVWLNKLPVKDRMIVRATILDITERRKHQNELSAFIKFQEELINKIKEQELSVSAVINSSSDYIFSVDHKLNLTEFNDAFKKIIDTNFKTELKKGANFKQFIIPSIIESSMACFQKAFEGESVNDMVEYIGKTGQHTYMSTIYSPIYSAKEEVIGVAVISRNITESKKAEEQLMEINRQVSEYKLKALRSAMNPHFLFNSLNSIQYFVAKNERKLALDYLSVFAILIRKILDSSVNDTIPLSAELEILKHYISLEKLRFENKFDFEIIVDEEIDVDQISIPSLLIQPYVENAILHGLNNKEGKGILEIHFSKKDSHLLISVRDNGIGRKNSSIFKNPEKSKSYGMLLTQERLEMVNKTGDVSVTITDLTDETGNPSGTRIDLLIKI